MGNMVDIGITVVLCRYLWTEKTGVPYRFVTLISFYLWGTMIYWFLRRTDVMLNSIIVVLVNRGAVAA